MSLIANYGSSFAQWRKACTSEWQRYIGHSFVEGLANGSLPSKAFLHYLVQDYVYLVHYSRAWALGVVKAETLAEMRSCAATVDALVNHEMALHVQICGEAGISEAQLFDAVEEDENTAYTRYVIDAGLSGDFLDLMAALAPCAFGYGEIGLNIAQDMTQSPQIKNNPYQTWIDSYSGDDFQNMCINLGKMIDDAIVYRLGEQPQKSPRWAALQKRFTRATQLEAKFWDMGLRGAD